MKGDKTVSRYMGKIGVMNTGESKAVIVLFDVNEDNEKTSYTFSLVDYFQAFSRVVLEHYKKDGDIQLHYDSTYEDEERLEFVLLPDHVDLKELAAYLAQMASDEEHTVTIDFAN